MVRFLLVTVVFFSFFESLSQEGLRRTQLAGVYQGKTLFIQNPFSRDTRTYCIEYIFINDRLMELNYNLSAIKLDFDEYDLYTPVNIEIVHKDSLCAPVIINPEAVLFHTIFRFSSVDLTDSVMRWTTKGERGIGSFDIEKLDEGIWVNEGSIEGKDLYEGASYTFFPVLEEGPNKYRIRYNFPEGSRVSHLYSRELDHDHYPEPVEFRPYSAKTTLYLSRATPYEVYDANGELTLTGQGSKIDITRLRRGQYVIYFGGKDPGTFTKE